jgi:hypothetical protein
VDDVPSGGNAVDTSFSDRIEAETSNPVVLKVGVLLSGSGAVE